MRRFRTAFAITLCTSMLMTNIAFAEGVTEQDKSDSVWAPQAQTERTTEAKGMYDQVFGNLEMDVNTTNPDFSDMMNNFIYGDVFNQNDLLDLRERQLITLVSLTANQSYALLKLNAVASVNMGLSPEEVYEAVYHCTPYLGIAKTYEAVLAVNEAFEENAIELPVDSQTQISDEMRFKAGNVAQVQIFGPFMARNEADVEDGVTKYVTEWCFGDFYTRGSIDLKTRELLTMTILANMGADQLGAHVFGSRNVGYSKDEIIAAITQAMPYMGTPLTLSAIETVETVFTPPAE